LKDIRVDRDFIFKPKRNLHIAYKAGITYCRVPEFAARAIVAAGAGQIVERDDVSE
jgi:hypothetical protein